MLSLEEMEGNELSECSSGCESGWTMYLDQSEGNPWDPVCKVGEGDWEVEDEDGDDLSMISDASSGPPHLHEDDSFYSHQCGENGFCSCLSSASSLFSAATSSRKDGKRRRVEAEHKYAVNCHERKPQDQGKQGCDSLDDTASSPLFSFSQSAGLNYGSSIPPVQDVVELSYGFSATHLKGKASLEKHMGYLKPNSAFPKSTGEGHSLRW